MHLLTELFGGVNDILSRDNTRLHGRRSIEIGTVFASLPVHDGTDLFRLQPEPLSIDGFNLPGECPDHIRSFVVIPIRKHRIVNHQYGIVSHERTVPRSPDNGCHRCGNTFDDTFRIYLAVGDSGIGCHAVQHLRVDQYAYARGAHDVLQKIELIIKACGILLGDAPEKTDNSRLAGFSLSDNILK